MTDNIDIDERISEGELIGIADNLQKIFTSNPDVSLVKASTIISGPKVSKVWIDVSNEPYKNIPKPSLKYADVIIKNDKGFDDLKFINIVKLGIGLHKLIASEIQLSAPIGVERSTNLYLERRGTSDSCDYEIRVATIGNEDEKTAGERLQQLVSGVKFLDNTGRYLNTFDKFSNSEH